MEKIAVAIGGGDIFGWNFKTKDDKNFEYNLRKVDEYIRNLGYGVGVSERLRTCSISRLVYIKRLVAECIKWVGTIILWFFYAISFRLPKGNVLVRFRYNVSRGLISGRVENNA